VLYEKLSELIESCYMWFLDEGLIYLKALPLLRLIVMM